DEQVELVERYAKEQGLWHDDESEEPKFSEKLELDLSEVKPSLAGPTRPQDRVPLDEAKQIYRSALAAMLEAASGNGQAKKAEPPAKAEARMEAEGGASEPERAGSNPNSESGSESEAAESKAGSAPDTKSNQAPPSGGGPKPVMAPDTGRLPDRGDEMLPFNVEEGTVEASSAESFPASDPPATSDLAGDGGANKHPYPPAAGGEVPEPPTDSAVEFTLEDG